MALSCAFQLVHAKVVRRRRVARRRRVVRRRRVARLRTHHHRSQRMCTKRWGAMIARIMRCTSTETVCGIVTQIHIARFPESLRTALRMRLLLTRTVSSTAHVMCMSQHPMTMRSVARCRSQRFQRFRWLLAASNHGSQPRSDPLRKRRQRARRIAMVRLDLSAS